jgi:hypothetical protein
LLKRAKNVLGQAVIESNTTANRSRIEGQIVSLEQRIALRTAFVARFIVLREARRTRAHRTIEAMSWAKEATAEELYGKFRQAFIDNGDKMQPVDRDLRRAFDHARRSVDYFVKHYVERSTTTFRDALADYERSNQLLFGEENDDAEQPRAGGWRLAGKR